MSLLRTLALAIEVATQKRDAASKALGAAQQAEIAAQNQLKQLETYAVETDMRWATQGKLCAVPELMRHHYQFVERLHHAMQMQREILLQHAAAVANARNVLLQAEMRVATLKQVCTKKQAVVTLTQRRREQKQMDELASVRFSARQFNGGS
ncbi:flagellar export protein FliJ [Variovorax sp. HJSM1_2]|uniref:flagellar export protein FliJ n=1 Tax=Variovorax sp. HJSM1_2 TaxID=3366263 RepID=UPI003BEC141F